MSSYTTAADIEGYFMGLDIADSSDNFSTAQIDKDIEEMSLFIDMKLKKKYQLPFSDDDDLTYLKLICEKLVVDKMDKILRITSDSEEKKYDRLRNLGKEARDMLESLLNGDIELNAIQNSFQPIKYNKTNNCCEE